MNEILTNEEKKIVLYFKGHYPVTNMMEDLRVLVEPIYGNGIKGISDRNIYDTVLEIFFKLQKSGHIKIDMQVFLEDLFLRKSFEEDFNEVLNKEKVIKRMRQHIMLCRVKGLNLDSVTKQLS